MTDLDVRGMRQRILEQAADLFVTQGYNGLSMREIAEACGLSKAGLYYHFKDKEDLFLAILSDHLQLLEQLLDEVDAQGQNAPERVRLLVEAMFTRLPAGKRPIIRLASQEMHNLSPEARTGFHRRYEAQFIGRIRRILEEGVRAGEFSPLDAGLSVWCLLGLMYPFMNQDNAAPAGPIITLITTIFLQGVQAKPSGQVGCG